MLLGRSKLDIIGLLIIVLVIIFSLLAYLRFFKSSKELRPVSYKGIDLKYGEYKQNELSKTTYTGVVSNIKKLGTGDYVFIKLYSSSKDEKEFILDPSLTLVTILEDPNQAETTWKIYKPEELMTIIKVGSTVTLRYDDQQAGKYTIIIHSYN